MKKITLTSLLAVLAVSGAHAANVIDGNPLYMPKKGHFYSETALQSHSEGTPWTLAEKFGFGVADKLTVEVGTSLTENRAFDYYTWNDLSLKATFRAFEKDGVVADLYGQYAAGANAMATRLGLPGALMYYPNINDEHEWFDKDVTHYAWTAGLRAGYTTSTWTVAGHAAFSYMNSESFNFGDKGTRTLALGVDAQYVLNNRFNLVAGAEYTGIINDHLAYADMEDPDEVDNGGVWTGYFGVNYNIDATKYVGAYISGDMNHKGGDANDEWDVEKGFGFGVKFGIDF